MIVEYKGTKIETCQDVYEPAEDTFLLLDALESIGLEKTDSVLEIGTGTGIVAIHVAKRVGRVTATDVNQRAAMCAKRNARMNGARNTAFVVGDIFSMLNGKYDVIIFNLPYLPQDEGESFGGAIERAWDGGLSGREVTERFIAQATLHLNEGGRIIMIDSSQSEYEKTILRFKENGYHAEIIGRLKLFFEELFVIEAKKRVL